MQTSGKLIVLNFQELMTKKIKCLILMKKFKSIK